LSKCKYIRLRSILLPSKRHHHIGPSEQSTISRNKLVLKLTKGALRDIKLTLPLDPVLPELAVLVVAVPLPAVVVVVVPVVPPPPLEDPTVISELPLLSYPSVATIW
jgi:hypothetical protein